MNNAAAAQSHFESQALHADIRGSGAAGSSSSLRSPKSRRQRRSHHVRHHVGKEVAERAKFLSDSEWESVPLEDKHAFTKYMSEMLREHPTQTTPQQRRRYFETSMVDPRDVHPEETVSDVYERLKLGLPVRVINPKHSLGVPQAVHDASDASLFSAEKTAELEEYMVTIKQLFADYIRHRREGKSTEMERRRLAHMTQEFHEETQRHLGNLFKYAEHRLLVMAREERVAQLRQLEQLKRELRAKKRKDHKTVSAVINKSREEEAESSGEISATKSNDGKAEEGKEVTDSEEKQAVEGNDKDNVVDGSGSTLYSPDFRYKKGKRSKVREASVRRFLVKALGVEAEVAKTVWEELEAQTTFLQYCEVFARLTTRRGFFHSAGDETLDEYTKRIKKLYSADPAQWGTLEVVQYLAAKDTAHPVAWAKEWYERVVRISLERVPAYQRLEAIRQEDMEALRYQKKAKEQNDEEEAHSLNKMNNAINNVRGGEGEPKLNNIGGGEEEEEKEEGVKKANALLDDAQNMNTHTNNTNTNTNDNNNASSSSPPSLPESHALAIGFEKAAASVQKEKAIRLVEKMFLKPDDPRLASLHEKRLRYIAYVQMEEQIQQARENARRYACIEDSAPEAERCRELYAALLERGAQFRRERMQEKANDDNSNNNGIIDMNDEDDAEHAPLPAALFREDAESVKIFEEISRLVIQVMQRVAAEESAAATATRTNSTSHRRLRRIRAALTELKENLHHSASESQREELAARRSALAKRLLDIAERDVKSEMSWIESMEEAARPPLIPVPVEGMSYISAADVRAWHSIKAQHEAAKASPFAASARRRQQQLEKETKGSIGKEEEDGDNNSSNRVNGGTHAAARTTRSSFHASFLGQPWNIPDKPLLFWGTGVRAVQQALEQAAAEASYRRQQKEILPPPYPCAENPWGWRVVKDILDD